MCEKNRGDISSIDMTGFDYKINPKDLIIDDVANSGVRDDSSGSIGSVGHSDSFFNDDMVNASKAIDDILRMGT